MAKRMIGLVLVLGMVGCGWFEQWEHGGAGNPDAGMPTGQECKQLGGICTTADRCVSPGKVIHRGDGECYFNDQPGVCCLPPAPLPTGDSCSDRGGVCAPFSGCSRDDIGWNTPSTGCVVALNNFCCVPRSQCTDLPTFHCCKGGDEYEIGCDRGQFVCLDGTKTPLQTSCASVN